MVLVIKEKMVKTFFILAILVLPNGQLYHQPHGSIEFKTFKECVDFVNENADGVVIGLSVFLADQYGPNNNIGIKEIGCASKFKLHEDQELFPDTTNT